MQTVKLIPKGETAAETLTMTVFLNAMPFINIVDDEILIRGKQYIFSTLELTSGDDTNDKDFELSIRKGLEIKNAVNFLVDTHIDLLVYTGVTGKKYALNGQNDKAENGVYLADGTGHLAKNTTAPDYFDQYGKGSIFKIKEGDYAGRFFFAPTTKKFNNDVSDEAFQFLEIKESQLDISILNDFDEAFEVNHTINATSDSVLISRPNAIPFPFIQKMATNVSRKLRDDITEAGRDVDIIINGSGSDSFNLFINVESGAPNVGKGINIQIRHKVTTAFLKNLLLARLKQGLNSSIPYNY